MAQIITPQKAKLGPDNNTTAYIYIYIYGCYLDWWAQKWPKSQKIPNVIVKKGQQKLPQNCGGFCCVLDFFFLNFFVFFSLVLLSSCCFMISWNPNTAHQMRLQAYYGWIRNPFLLHVDDFGPKHLFLQCFQ